MRFRFCGDLEAPTWLLHEVPTLSEVSSVRLKLLAKQVLHRILHGSLDEAKVLRFTTPKGAEPDLAVARGTISAIHFLIASAVKRASAVRPLPSAFRARRGGETRPRDRSHRPRRACRRYDVDDDTFSTEIEQLGLPRENAAAILRPYRESKSALRSKFAADTFAVSKTSAVDWSVRRDGSAFTLRMTDPDVALDVDPDKFAVFLHEMNQVKAMMDVNQDAAA